MRVGVYVEGSPAGGLSPAEVDLLRGLAASGADVRVMVNATGYPSDRRYRLDHAKYALIDGTTVVVCSDKAASEAMVARVPIPPFLVLRGFLSTKEAREGSQHHVVEGYHDERGYRSCTVEARGV